MCKSKDSEKDLASLGHVKFIGMFGRVPDRCRRKANSKLWFKFFKRVIIYLLKASKATHCHQENVYSLNRGSSPAAEEKAQLVVVWMNKIHTPEQIVS